MLKNFRLIIVVITSLSLVSCSSYHPILDQNEKYLTAGEVKAEQDINLCRKEADNYLNKYKAERAAKEAGRKALIGGITGAAVGAIWGKGVKSVLIGTAIGAGAGAAIGGISVMGEDKIKPDEIKQRYLTKCLGRKGYSVIGWR